METPAQTEKHLNLTLDCKAHFASNAQSCRFTPNAQDIFTPKIQQSDPFKLWAQLFRSHMSEAFNKAQQTRSSTHLCVKRCAVTVSASIETKQLLWPNKQRKDDETEVRSKNILEITAYAIGAVKENQMKIFEITTFK